LAPDVAIREASVAPDAFDARFSASAREYRYVIDTNSVPDPFTGRFTWQRASVLHVPTMRRAAGPLLGEHDFASFCRQPGGNRSTVRDLQRLAITREGSLVVFGFRANGFLHQMVRVLVGTLAQVGEGRLAPEEMGRILRARSRAAAARAAPAHGLSLERVIYGRRRPPLDGQRRSS
jgi:tRNA pseudouridine38-40 synthase